MSGHEQNFRRVDALKYTRVMTASVSDFLLGTDYRAWYMDHWQGMWSTSAVQDLLS